LRFASLAKAQLIGCVSGEQEVPMSDQERHVERETVLEASPSEVWEALTDERLLGEWLAQDAELEPEPGGRASFRFADGEEREGTVLEVEEERSLAFSWARPGEPESVVEFALEPAVGGTRLVVVERGPALTAAVARPQWALRLDAFAAALALVAA
jgi:uncharacterized protein YndB with AHSA1/START domain